MYILERSILVAVHVIAAGLLLFIPRGRMLQAHFVYLSIVIPTWIMGLCVVEWKLIEYPIREFAQINRTSFVFEYFLFPVVCVLFVTHYPKARPLPYRLAYYAAACSIMTLLEWLLERYTGLVRYIHWDWYITFLSEWLIFLYAIQLQRWFFRPSGSRMVQDPG